MEFTFLHTRFKELSPGTYCQKSDLPKTEATNVAVCTALTQLQVNDIQGKAKNLGVPWQKNRKLPMRKQLNLHHGTFKKNE